MAHSDILDQKVKSLTATPIFEAGPFMVTVECQFEDDVVMANKNTNNNNYSWSTKNFIAIW